MKVFFAILALLPFVMCYDEKFDKIDVDKIIADDKLFTEYINCLLDKGPCEVEHSAEFKKLLPEVLATTCEKCSPTQRKNFRKTARALQAKNPEAFTDFREKYDPKGEYEQKFMTFMTSNDK